MSQWQPDGRPARPPVTPPQFHGRANVHPHGQPQYPQNFPQQSQFLQYPPPGWRPPAQVAPKSTGLAILLGLLIPGLGCMYAGRAWLGVALLAAWIVSLVLVLLIIGWVLVPACWIASGVLGYTSAQAWNRERGIIS
jgi:TM2 domain-containing membrane protein YozV